MDSHRNYSSSMNASVQHNQLYGSQQSNNHDEILSTHMRLQEHTSVVAAAAAAAALQRKHGMIAVAPPSIPPTSTLADTGGNGVYVINHSGDVPSADATADFGDMQNISTTLDRKHHNRLSWMNMRRKGEETASNMTSSATTPTAASSPHTTRSYVSTAVTSGRSASGVTTISGSQNTLNDIHSDYHSHEAVSSNDDYRYGGRALSAASITPATPHKNLHLNHSNNGSFNLANGSTAKLLPAGDDEKNQQTKCSIFRGLVLCICLNITYANIVRFPRELNRYGTTFLVPYVVLLLLVGLPVMLLEISVGQFLGQGAAHTWRASPIFKGACIISRFASFLSTVWISMQSVLALGYIGKFAYDTMPFKECISDIKAVISNGYTLIGNNGQECLLKTFLTPFWENPLYLGLLSIGLFAIWTLVMLCTHNAKILRRSLFLLGITGFVLLCCLTGWEVYNSLEHSYFPDLHGFEKTLLYGSNIWFNALMQVIFSINCGTGVLPMITGKFLYKGDAVRTAMVYLCFNLLVTAISVTLFMVQFDYSSDKQLYELQPLTAIYDRVLNDVSSGGTLTARVLPILMYVLLLMTALITISLAIYTATRLVPRHPSYVISLVALVLSIVSLVVPNLQVSRLLDSRIVGTLLVTALIFELIATTWIYGAKNIYTDLEFSIGRPIFKGWMGLWCLCPAILTGVLVWWCSDDDQWDLLWQYMPRWAPILFALAIIFLIACIQIFRQVEYNFFGMICEASKPAKEWGPADPLARHSWKQWRSVCQDTGRRDFTLRRRGTRDYTHSIKKGQYSSNNVNSSGIIGSANDIGHKYGNGGLSAQSQPHWKSSTPGNSSPNYSGSMFGDSAIEEDISVDKYPGMIAQPQQFVPFSANSNNEPSSADNHAALKQANYAAPNKVRQPAQRSSTLINTNRDDKHREIVYIRRLSDDGRHATRIEITPNESIIYGGRNPMSRIANHGGHMGNSHVKRSSSINVNEYQRSAAKSPTALAHNGNGDHICWRKFGVNAEEYSTEL